MNNPPPAILLVDDNKANLLAMEAVLEPLGLRIVRAMSGSQALQMSQSDEFAAILLDVRMPGIDGFETAVRLRQQNSTRYTPIIFLTAAAEAGEEHMLRGYAEGGADFIMKPLQPEILRSKVKVFATIYHQARELRRTIRKLEDTQREVGKLNAELEQRVEERTREANQELARRQVAQEALREANERLRGIMDNAAVAIQIKDLDGKYLLVNRYWELITGRKRDDALGKTPFDVFPADVARALLNSDKAALRAGTSLQVEESAPFSDGSHLFISTKFPLFSATGQPYAVGAISIDITERRRVQEALHASESRFRALFEQSPISIQIITPDGYTVRANRAWERLWNTTVKQLEGYSILEDRSLAPYGITEVLLRAFRGESVEIPAIYFDPEAIGRKGRARWVEPYFYPIMDEEKHVAEVALMLMDVTERKNNEVELLRLNKELTEARDAALEASQAKSTFLANMSHELRTPLNAIIGYAEMLHEEMQEQGNTQTADDLGKIRLSGQHLLAIISDILDISKIEAGRLQLVLEEFSPEEVVKEAITLVVPLIEKQKNTIRFECRESGLKMNSDRTRLRQIIFNLLSNAAKFTENGEITVICDQRVPGTLRVIVADTGIGMSTEEVEGLFQKFHQLDDSTTRRHGGTGLGLAISKLLCSMLGGQISVESRAGAGSTFTVELPLRAE